MNFDPTVLRPDIIEHMPTLMRYAEASETIVEFGTAYGTSTQALLRGRPRRLDTYDIEIPFNLEFLRERAAIEGVDFRFHLESTVDTVINETDLLFIDTWHIYSHLKKELTLHGNKAKKYIIMHDTENFKFGDHSGGPGLWPAIEEFLADNPNWSIKEHFTNNNGLTVLERKVT